MRHLNLRSMLGASVAAYAIIAAAPSWAQTRTFNVPAQSAVSGIPEFARQADIQILVSGAAVEGKSTMALNGAMPVSAALERLIAGTGLKVASTDGRTFTLASKDAPRGNGGSELNRLAPSSDTAAGEIVVTANKREERLIEVAGSVSAVSGDQLQKMGAQSLTDYVTKLPGIHFNDYVPGRSEVVIRGISTTTYHDPSQPVVAYYVNDIPLTEPGFPVLIPDVDAFDLNRVEVLRGPQGSLFGSASLGGAINYLVNQADTGKIDAAAEASIGSTRNSNGQVNYTLKGMINLPLIADKLAIRAVAYERSDAGYIDNIILGTKGVNDVRTRGLRGSVVFTPTEATKITLTSMYQKLKSENQPYVVLGTYNKLNGIEDPQSNEFQLYSIRLEQDLGFASLSLIGSRSKKDGVITYDQTADLAPLTGLAAIAREAILGRARSWYGEARLASKGDGPFRWLIGTNYASSRNTLNDRISQTGLAAFIDANPGRFGGRSGASIAPDDLILDGLNQQKSKDFGIFGEVGFKVVPELELTAGGRYYDTSSDGLITRGQDFLGYFVGSPPTIYNADQSASGFSPTASIAYRPNRDLTVYAKYAKGFRVGGPNPNPPGVTGLPVTYEADSVDNYEVGLHAALLDRRLSVDVAVFRIDWDNIQVRQFTAQGFSYVANAGGARSEGVEFSGSLQVLPELNLATAISYQNARLTEFLPYLFAANGNGGYPAGTRLPGSSKWTVSNTATLALKDAPLSPSLAISHRYLSKAPVSFQAVLPRGGYSLFDTRLTVKAVQNVDLMLFVNNIFDKYGLLSAPFSDLAVNPQGTATRPRTIGLRLNWNL